MKVRIPLKKKSDYYLFLLTLLKPFPPYKLLRQKEVEILSSFLSKNYEKRNIAYEDRMKLIFDENIKKQIAKNHKIPMGSLYNIIVALKKKGFLVGTPPKLSESFLSVFNPDVNTEITFQIDVQSDK